MPTRSLSLGTLLVALTSPLAAQAVHPDLNGTWVLDASKTVIDGQMEAPVTAIYVVVQVGDSLSVDQKMTMASAGEVVVKKVWKVDGKPWANNFSYGGVPMVLTSTLRWNGAVLTMHTTSDFQGNAVDQTETWTVGPDGKTLTESTTTNVNGDYFAAVTLVYVKK
jgi:hypothetical protein